MGRLTVGVENCSLFAATPRLYSDVEIDDGKVRCGSQKALFIMNGVLDLVVDLIVARSLGAAANRLQFSTLTPNFPNQGT